MQDAEALLVGKPGEGGMYSGIPTPGGGLAKRGARY